LLSPAKRFKAEVILAARRVNDGMPLHLVKMAERAMRDNGVKIQEARIAVMGLAFLSDSDDTRNSPAIKVIDHFVGKAKSVTVHDPFVAKMYKAALVREPFEALSGADCAIFVTDHREYFTLDLDKMKGKMSTPLIIDGRNIFEAQECKRRGIAYYGVGKGGAF
jgi:UDP-N-acetyl-D-mannosaminuronate dehydrogenase